jgi:hypothetical protein
MNPDDLRNWLASVAAELRSHKWLLPVLAILVAAAIVIPVALSKSGTPASVQSVPAAPSVTVPASTSTTPRHHAPSQNYLTGPAHNPFVSNTQTATTAAASTATNATSSGHTSAAGSSSSAGGSASSKKSSTTKTTTTTEGCPSGTRKVIYKGEPLCVEKVCPHGTVAADIDGRLACLAPGERCTAAYDNSLGTYGYRCVDGRVEPETKVKTTTGPYTDYQVELSLRQPSVSSVPTVFHNAARDQLLPNDDNIFGAFLGVRTDATTAVFVLTAHTSVTGQGRCTPSASSCEFLMLEPGQTAELTVHPPNGPTSAFVLRYVKLTKVLSSGSIVAVDSTGAAEIQQASGYVTQLRNAQYTPYTGLLSIGLGAAVPVAP